MHQANAAWRDRTRSAKFGGKLKPTSISKHGLKRVCSTFNPKSIYFPSTFIIWNSMYIRIQYTHRNSLPWKQHVFWPLQNDRLRKWTRCVALGSHWNSRPVVPARCAPARQWTMTFLPLAKAEPARGWSENLGRSGFLLELGKLKGWKRKLQADCLLYLWVVTVRLL